MQTHKMALWLLVFFFTFTVTAGCRDSKSNTAAPAFVGRPVVVKTPFANWIKDESRILLSLNGGVFDLAGAKYHRTKLDQAYKLFFRDFTRRTLGRMPVYHITEELLHEYEQTRGLPQDQTFVTADHVREMVADADIAEEYWDGQYASMVPAGDVYPQPYELKKAAEDDPGLYSATAMASLVQLQATGRAMIPEAHRQAVGLLTIDKLPTAWGIYIDSGLSPRPGQGQVRGHVVLATDLLGLYPNGDNQGKHSVYVFLHEVGHAVDFRVFVEDANGTDTSLSFYDVSWDKWTRRIGNKDLSDMITAYSTTNPWEDFAEHYSYFIFYPDEFQRKVKNEWLKAGATTTAARAEVPIFKKYWLMWVALGQREYGTPDPEISAVLTSMPKAWPAPPVNQQQNAGGLGVAERQAEHCCGIPRQ